MEKILNLRRGLDLKLDGAADGTEITATVTPQRVAITPDDFPGFTPKALVKEGDRVMCGQPVLRAKECESICLCSPAAGVVEQVVRGDRRKILRVVIAVDAADSSVYSFNNIEDSPAAITDTLMKSGLWVAMRQRPYDIVPREGVTPVNIFVTGIDSAPLAAGFEAEAADKAEYIAAGVSALQKLTSGHIYISVRPETNIPVPAGAEKVTVSGPHPAGNAGVQAANIAPVNKGETIWTLDILTLIRVGQLVKTGKVDFSTVVTVAGPEVIAPKRIATIDGAEIAPLLKDNVKDDSKHHRIISGNVLTGVKVESDGYLRFPYRQITVIAEGDDVAEFMGWASMSPSKLSVSRAFPFKWFKKSFAPDARLLGGRRAMIMSGQYDKLLPMDIMPEYLIKAILARDIEKMEQLGIYEVAPEDFALCEFADPSKLELQKIVREGLDYLRKELE